MLKLTEKGKQLYEATKGITPAMLDILSTVNSGSKYKWSGKDFLNFFLIEVTALKELRSKGLIEGD